MVFESGILFKGLMALGVAGVAATTGIMFSGEIKGGMERVGGVIWRTLDPRITENLGIDNEECEWKRESSTYEHCTLNNKDLNGIMFSDRAGNRVAAKTDSTSANLIIEKLFEEEFREYPEGLRITLTNTDPEHSIVIGEGDNRIELKRSQYTFRIKKHSEKEWSLERAYDLKTIGEEVGLVCGEGENVDECTFSSSGVNVWDEEDYVIEANVEGEGNKIKVSRNKDDRREGFEFTVEREITLSEGTHKDDTKPQLQIKKLFPNSVRKTSYQIDTRRISGFDFWFLVENVGEENNNKDLNRKLRLAGIQDHSCHLGSDPSATSFATKTCNLDKEKLGALDFYEKDNTKEINLETGKTVELTIKKIDDEENKGFSHNLAFQFTNRNNDDVVIPRNKGKNNRPDITLKPNVTYDFRIRTSSNYIRLEPSDLTKTGKILGLKCTESKNECYPGGEINVWKGEGDYWLNAKIPTNRKITVEKDAAGYRRGFKYKSETDITLKEGHKSKENGVAKILKSAIYEMDLKETPEGRKWFLVEKPSGN